MEKGGEAKAGHQEWGEGILLHCPAREDQSELGEFLTADCKRERAAAAKINDTPRKRRVSLIPERFGSLAQRGGEIPSSCRETRASP